MVTAPRILRIAIACALLATAMSTAASARPLQDLRSPDARDAAQTSSLAGTISHTRQDLRSPDSRDAARAEEIALAQERYDASYREPEPPVVAQSPAPSDDSPWLPVALFVAAAFAVIAASAVGVGRVRIRRRRAAQATP
jgi:hypothetical protein